VARPDGRSRIIADSGQAAAELVAVVPLVIAALLAVAQLAVAGYALWSAADAARAGARAAYVDGDPERAARSALPGWLEDGARIDAGDADASGASLAVELKAPALIPGVPAIPIRARAGLGPGGSEDG
jgi:hypothetical protein